MLITRMADVSESCVPVSTAGTQLSKNETESPQIGQETDASVYELAEAINLLIDAGWTLGCDGELLPPLVYRKQQVRACA